MSRDNGERETRDDELHVILINFDCQSNVNHRNHWWWCVGNERNELIVINFVSIADRIWKNERTRKNLVDDQYEVKWSVTKDRERERRCVCIQVRAERNVSSMQSCKKNVREKWGDCLMDWFADTLCVCVLFVVVVVVFLPLWQAGRPAAHH